MTCTIYSNKWEFTFYKFVVVVCSCCNCYSCLFVCLFVCLFCLFFLFFLFLYFKFEFLSTDRGSFFSNLLLCKIIDMACYIAMVFISMKVFF